MSRNAAKARTERVVVRMTLAEKARIRELAELEGVPVGEVLRQAALDIHESICALVAEVRESTARLASSLDATDEASRRHEAGRAKKEDRIRAKVKREISDLDIEALAGRIAG